MKRTAFPFVIICLLISFSSAVAQTTFSYVPVKDDSIQLVAIKQTIRQQFVQDSTGMSGEYKKYFREIYKERYDYLSDMFKNKEMLGSTASATYLNALASEIIRSNPVLQKLNPRILFSRAYWPNAASTGEGTIVFNIGLFDRLDNESQAVFVLCHELAHLYLNHSNNAINQYVTTVYSDDFQKELKRIKKTTYEKNKELEKLVKGFAFKSRRHSREHESEADSMGLVFMKNTRFDTREALSTLALLDTIDKDTINIDKKLPALFNFPQYAFRDRWLKREDVFFGSSAKDDDAEREADSLKTHPDCKVRIQRLTPTVDKLDNSTTKKFLVNEPEFDSLRRAFRYEIVDYCFKMGLVSRSLYSAIELFKDNPQDAYLAGMIGRCFNTMYNHQKEHTLNKIVDLPSPAANKNYNMLLEFIQNIQMQDMAAISYYFMRQHEYDFSNNETFLRALIKSKDNFDMASEKEDWLKKFRQQFPNATPIL